MERRRSSRDSSEDHHRSRKPRRRDSSEEPPKASQDEVEVTVTDKEYTHRALESFNDADFPSAFYTVIDKLGFVKPTPIQANGNSFESSRLKCPERNPQPGL